MEQEIELIVSCDGVLTRVVGAFIVLETLVQMSLTFGVVECVRGLVLLGNSRIGFALQLTAPVKKVLKLVKPIAHPPRVWARRVIARHEATATIRGHPEAVEVVVIVQLLKTEVTLQLATSGRFRGAETERVHHTA